MGLFNWGNKSSEERKLKDKLMDKTADWFVCNYRHDLLVVNIRELKRSLTPEQVQFNHFQIFECPDEYALIMKCKVFVKGLELALQSNGIEICKGRAGERKFVVWSDDGSKIIAEHTYKTGM
jgi:hypothetical protein